MRELSHIQKGCQSVIVGGYVIWSSPKPGAAIDKFVFHGHNFLVIGVESREATTLT